MSAVPKLISRAFKVRSAVTMRQKSTHPREAERQTSPASGMRMMRVR
jgi:hypothetical protein